MKKGLLFLLLLPAVGFSQLISEDFEGGIPATWSLGGDGEWTSTDNAWEVFFPSNVAILDDDAGGDESIVSNAQLLSPVVDLTNYNNLNLSFDYGNYIFDFESSLNVEVYDGTDWVNVLSAVGDNYVDDIEFAPLSTTIDVTAYANPNFQVRFIYDDAGDWSFGAVVDNVVLTGTLGINDLTSDKATGIYPNPASSFFNVKLGSQFNSESVKVTLTDVSGKTVRSFAGSDTYVVSDIAPGMYIVNITDGKMNENRKLVIK